MKALEINKDFVIEYFDYKNGELFWKKTNNYKIKIGAKAGNKDSLGYINIKIKGQSYKAHRLIYVYHNGALDKNLQINHINGIRNDNRIENLRVVSNTENQRNQVFAKGYCFHKASGKFMASIRVNRKDIYLGLYHNEFDAKNAYILAKEKYHKIGV